MLVARINKVLVCVRLERRDKGEDDDSTFVAQLIEPRLQLWRNPSALGRVNASPASLSSTSKSYGMSTMISLLNTYSLLSDC